MDKNLSSFVTICGRTSFAPPNLIMRGQREDARVVRAAEATAAAAAAAFAAATSGGGRSEKT